MTKKEQKTWVVHRRRVGKGFIHLVTFAPTTVCTLLAEEEAACFTGIFARFIRFTH